MSRSNLGSISSSDLNNAKLEEHQMYESKQCLAKEMKSHPFIDEFIPIIEGEDGIYYTHPKKLSGYMGRHFSHRPSKAYTMGKKKEKFRMSATYRSTTQTLARTKNFEKTNWVMHQYHLGQHKEEKEIFYQKHSRDETSGATVAIAISSYSAMDIKNLKYNHFNYPHFRKSFENQIATIALHISRPSHPIFTIIKENGKMGSEENFWLKC
ncbi:hypothetical protein K2173_006959 [Erythroxylum novogranatense]|uniref:NAC domain-containing protein n=1 Tax=Erythroxylum novogranatense TaxID=1862640 RepID=A0AAV8SY76_9ROSI|nr:hypothetical protein K2173_006959 [Erythroxylum novogranatense]